MTANGESGIRYAEIQELAYKLREQAGANRRPRFALFLGAGASISSGIPGTKEMIRHFKEALNARRSLEGAQEPFDTWLSKQKWYQESSSEYSTLFEVYEPKPWGRQQYIEHLIDGKNPFTGYLFLANLIRCKHIDTIITTNFDDLVYSACTRWTDVRPVVYAYGLMASEIRFGAQRPKILKLHGDFLYSKLKNTSLEISEQDPNMVRQLIQLFQEEGLVVIGYSGGDSSILDILMNYFPSENDLYWCITRGHEPNERVQDILRKKGGFLVEIESFDQAIDDILYRCTDCLIPPAEEEMKRRYVDLGTYFIMSKSPNIAAYLSQSEVGKAVMEALSSLNPDVKRENLPSLIASLEIFRSQSPGTRPSGVEEVHRRLEDELVSLSPDAQEARQKIMENARGYEAIRAALPSGNKRTSQMSEIVVRTRSLAGKANYTQEEIREIFEKGSPGNRIIALSILSKMLYPDCFGIVLQAIGDSKSAFEQYNALTVANDMLSSLGNGQKLELKTLLEKLSSALASDRDQSRWSLSRRMLDAIKQNT